jgi:hypothetical protein
VPTLARPERSQLGLERHVPGHYLCCGRYTHREAIMATRKPALELFYDPADLTPRAPRLYVRRNGRSWELRDEEDTVLGTHSEQGDAIEDALDRSAVRFSEILVRGSTGRMEWLVDQDPEILKATEPWRKKRKAEKEAAD